MTCKEIISVLILIIALGIAIVSGSAGDRSWFYQKTVRNCYTTNCTNEDIFRKKQPLHRRLLGWECLDECKYESMWLTVDAFKKDGSGVPQFHGKWPFIRLLGMQEPASVVFSILNALAHLGIIFFRRQVPSTAPMYYVWHGAALVAANAWLWSTVFHTRDTNFTEKMDYFFAFSVVLYNVFCFSCRVLGTGVKWRVGVIGLFLLALFLQHIYYLGFIKFDYGYNMKMNLGIGVINMIGWLAWCYLKRRKQKYLWKCAAVVLGINALLSLELLDFPPVWWTFDAHSLWHAGTAPLALLWYSFIIEDTLYENQKMEDLIMKLE